MKGHKELLGIWPARRVGGVLVRVPERVEENCSVRDVVFVVCDGVKGLSDGIGTVFGQGEV